MSVAPVVVLSDIALTLGDSDVIDSLSVKLAAAQWHSVLGRSGVGKSSLLRLIAGLLKPDAGRISFDNSLGDDNTRNIRSNSTAALMSQDDGLLPWLSAVENVQLRHRLRGTRTRHTIAEALEMLDHVGLTEHASALPSTMSGGMRQRVALARTLMEQKPLVLLDEPFSRLDAITRAELQILAFELITGKTVVMVTHDPLEAIRLSHHVYVMEHSSVTTFKHFEISGTPPRSTQSESAMKGSMALWAYLEIDSSLNSTTTPQASPVDDSKRVGIEH